MRPQRVRLRKDLAEALRGGHPWIYRDALAAPPSLRTGEVADVVDAQGALLARCLYDETSPLALRVYTRDPAEAVDGKLLRRRLASALSARRGVIDRRRTTAFRLCNGEGDLLPGVVVDVYGDVAVLRLDGEAVRALLPELVPALGDVTGELGVRTLYERSRGGQGALLLGPPPPDEIVVREHGVLLSVDVVRGQKTGLFLDQRDNRLLVRQVARGLSVWNGFSYTGGFSVQAALGGATRVISVDSAEGALQTARRNFHLNELDPAAHAFLCEDVFTHLRQALAMGQRYDLVIVDPPSFAPSQQALRKALGAYRDLFAQAMLVVARGGLLAAASCSSHVDMPAFLQVLGEAGVRAGRALRVLEVRTQPADHPSLPLFPEGRYLKFVLSRLDE